MGERGDGTMSQAKTAIETYEVTLEPSGKTITVKEGQTILDAAIRNGIQVAYGCRHGSCSACKCQVLDVKHIINQSAKSIFRNKNLLTAYNGCK